MRLPVRVACLTAGLLTGCAGGAGATDGPRAVPQAEPSSMPTDQRLGATATVIEGTSGPQLCLGPVALSLPPQCDGVPLVGWTWPQGAAQARYDFKTPCAEPRHGWQPLHPRRTTADDQDRAFARAETLPGYAGVWIDDRGHPAQLPTDIVMNVQVRLDVEEATQTLRRVWGGALCVSLATHTEAELTAIADELTKRPGALGCEVGLGFLDCSVVYDDGGLQHSFDSTYGEGLVQVTSALQPYRG